MLRVLILIVALLLPLALLAGHEWGLVALDMHDAPVYEDNAGKLHANARQLKRAFALVAQNTFYPGVYVDGVSLGGLTRDEGIKAVEAKAQALLGQIRFVLKARDEVVEITGQDLGAQYVIADAMNKAWAEGRTAVDPDVEQQVLKRYQSIVALRTKPFHATGMVTVDAAVVNKVVATKLANITLAPKPATATAFDPQTATFTFKEKVDGFQADAGKAARDIEALLHAGQIKGTVEVALTPVSGGMTAAELSKTMGLLSDASTPITTYDPARDKNLMRAAERINGTLVKPGETFSYVERLGPITRANGYDEASVLIQGLYERELGGGLCQPSTTLYQAALKADMEIVERRNHGRPSAYHQRGLDAMVDPPAYDFKFKNNSDYPIGIVATVAKGRVDYKIYGHKRDDGVTIKLESIKLQDIPPSDPIRELNKTLPPGTEKKKRDAIPGSVWETYKIYVRDGRVVEKVVANRSTYIAYAEIIEYGPTPTPTPTPPPTTKANPTSPPPPPPSATPKT